MAANQDDIRALRAAIRATADPWKRAALRAELSLARMTPEEDAAITAAAEADPDNPPLTDEFIAGMRPTSEVSPETVERARRARKRS